MNNLYDIKLAVFIIIDIIGLCLCAFLLKKCVKHFPNKLIPLLNMIFSIVTTILYFNRVDCRPSWLFVIVLGIVDGLAATGLHQLFKQTKKYFVIKKKINNFKTDKRKIIS